MSDFEIERSLIATKTAKGDVTTALNAVVATTTSSAIPVCASGFKNIKLELLGAAFTSGNYAVTITGCETLAGTYGSIYRVKEDGTYATVGSITVNSNVNAVYIIHNIAAEYIKITGTRTTDGTLTAKVTPFN